MSHLFDAMYAIRASDIEHLLSIDVVNLLMTSFLDKKIAELEKHDKLYGACRRPESKQWRSLKREFGIKDNEERWLLYTDKALENIDVGEVWMGIEEACKILGLASPSQEIADYFDSMYRMSWVILARTFNELKKTANIEYLIDYIMCVCKLMKMKIQ